MRIKKLFLTFISLFTALSAVSCNNTQTEDPNKEYTEMNETFYNPLAIEKGLGDPWLTKHEDYYYMNPGSTTLPKENSHHGYIVYEKRRFTWKDMEGKVIHECEL